LGNLPAGAGDLPPIPTMSMLITTSHTSHWVESWPAEEMSKKPKSISRKQLTAPIPSCEKLPLLPASPFHKLQ
jgi:hypothetical protein